MARLRSTIPAYQHHSSGRARVRTYDASGKRVEIVLPGDYGSDESKQEYERILSRLRVGNGALPAMKAVSDLAIAELVQRFMGEHVEQHYRRPDGTHTGEKHNFVMSFRPLVRLFGSKLAGEFTPLDLMTVREAMLTGSWMTKEEKEKRRSTRGGDGTTGRTETNKRIGRIRHLFKWAASMMLAPAAVWHGLQSVSGLQAGRGKARESKPVEAVPLEHVEATLANLAEIFADIVRVQLYSGARAGEVLRMRTCDIDQAGDVWVYAPSSHKNAWRGHKRRLVMGPRAQLILRRYLRPDAPEAFLFRPGTIRPGGRIAHRANYTVTDYDKAIGRACKKARVPHWSSHQLRHLAAQLAEREVSLEGARAYLGQKSVNMAAHYSGIDVKAAGEVAKRIG
jgi:integrase